MVLYIHSIEVVPSGILLEVKQRLTTELGHTLEVGVDKHAILVNTGCATSATTGTLTEVQPPLAHDIQYVVVADMDGVVNDVPVNKIAPPVDAAYQFTLPVQPLEPKITVPASQRELLMGMGGDIQQRFPLKLVGMSF